MFTTNVCDLQENRQSTIQVAAYGNYFKLLDPYQHPRVLHTYPHETYRYIDILEYDAHVLNGASIQTNPSNVNSQVARYIEESASYGNQWIVANDEQGSAGVGIPPDNDYRNGESIDELVSAVVWGTLMAGGHGVEAYFGYNRAHNDLNAEDWRSRNEWWNRCKIALDFFNMIPFSTMTVEKEVVNGGSYCLAQRGLMYIVYFKNSNSNTIDLSHTSGNFSVHWYVAASRYLIRIHTLKFSTLLL